MLLQPKVLEALCRATQAFVNLRAVESTAQVRAIFDSALARLGRTARLPNGTGVAPQLQWGDDIAVAQFEKDRRQARAWLTRIADHCAREQHRELTARHRGPEAQELRAELSGTLQRLAIWTTINFNEKAGTLRLFPLRFGVEAACYLTAAAMLEPGTSAYVRQCNLVGCPNLVLHPGGRRRPTLWCSALHGQQGQRRTSKRRTPLAMHK